MKILPAIFRIIFIVCLPILLLAVSIAWGFNSLWIYQLGFQKYQVSQSTGISSSDLDSAGRKMIEYFNSSDDVVQITVTVNGQAVNLFTREEQLHLKDVKQLVWADYETLAGSLIFCLGFTLIFWLCNHGGRRRWLAMSILIGCGISLAILLLMAAGTLFDFDQLFLKFHFLAFSNDFWSAPGYMIKLFAGLWYDAVLIGTGFMAGLTLLVGTAAKLYLHFSSRHLKLSEKSGINES